jgi:hypothetical protein
MKKLKLTKVIASSLIVASVIALNPIGASAEWRQTSSGNWWYANEHNSWDIEWSYIDGKWYYFYPETGYMATNTSFHTSYGDFYVGSDGAWVQPTEERKIDVVPPSSIPSPFHEDSSGTIQYFLDKNGNQETELNVPTWINGKQMTVIGEYAFTFSLYLTKVYINNGITTIKNYAFSWCQLLKDITIPESVTTIEPYAFYKTDNAIFHVKSERVKQLLINSGVKQANIIIEE